MREQLKRNERRGMKLIGIGRTERQDEVAKQECGCEYIKINALCELPRYYVTKRCKECLEKDGRA